MNDIIQQLEKALQAAKDIQQAETQTMLLPELAYNTRMDHDEQLMHKQDLLAIQQSNLSILKSCIKETHFEVNRWEKRNVVKPDNVVHNMALIMNAYRIKKDILLKPSNVIDFRTATVRA